MSRSIKPRSFAQREFLCSRNRGRRKESSRFTPPRYLATTILVVYYLSVTLPPPLSLVKVAKFPSPIPFRVIRISAILVAAISRERVGRRIRNAEKKRRAMLGVCVTRRKTSIARDETRYARTEGTRVSINFNRKISSERASERECARARACVRARLRRIRKGGDGYRDI